MHYSNEKRRVVWLILSIFFAIILFGIGVGYLSGFFAISFMEQILSSDRGINLSLVVLAIGLGIASVSSFVVAGFMFKYRIWISTKENG